MESRKQIQKKTIAHWSEMIEWARTQPPLERIDDTKMFNSIGQRWFSDDCDYCKKYTTNPGLESLQCHTCPLDGILSLPSSCCGGLWLRAACSKTWEQWIERAILLVEYVEMNG